MAVPELVEVRETFPRERVEDVERAVREALRKDQSRRPGPRPHRAAGPAADRAFGVGDLLEAQLAGARIVTLRGAHNRALVDIQGGAHPHLAGALEITSGTG
jgi:hypothetical protein